MIPRTPTTPTNWFASLSRDEKDKVFDHLSSFKRMIETVNNVDEKSGNTPLHRAALIGDRARVENLIGVDADPLIRDRNGNYPFDLVQNTDIVGIMLDAIDTTSEKFQDALLETISDGRTSTLEMLLKTHPQLDVSSFRLSPTLSAITNGNPECLRLLLDAGACPTRTSCGSNPIIDAIDCREFGCLEVLLSFDNNLTHGENEDSAICKLILAEGNHNDIIRGTNISTELLCEFLKFNDNSEYLNLFDLIIKKGTVDQFNNLCDLFSNSFGNVAFPMKNWEYNMVTILIVGGERNEMFFDSLMENIFLAHPGLLTDGETPLVTSCLFGTTHQMSILLNETGVDINGADSIGRLPLAAACGSREGAAKISELLSKKVNTDCLFENGKFIPTVTDEIAEVLKKFGVVEKTETEILIINIRSDIEKLGDELAVLQAQVMDLSSRD